ncbi:hypothetical protein N9J72_00165 [Candidatus Gracilibacteria bacterium]|nr:hypothetical protein [Candidatus Gracilibacteria bacterium]
MLKDSTRPWPRLGGTGEGLEISDDLKHKIILSKRRLFLSQVEGLLAKQGIDSQGAIVENIDIEAPNILVIDSKGNSYIIDLGVDISGLYRYTILELLKPRLSNNNMDAPAVPETHTSLHKKIQELDTEDDETHKVGPQLRVIDGGGQTTPKDKSVELREIEGGPRAIIFGELSQLFNEIDSTDIYLLGDKFLNISVGEKGLHRIEMNGLFDNTTGENKVNIDYTKFKEKLGWKIKGLERMVYIGGQNIQIWYKNFNTGLTDFENMYIGDVKQSLAIS